jgi:hypothetical protein
MLNQRTKYVQYKDPARDKHKLQVNKYGWLPQKEADSIP